MEFDNKIILITGGTGSFGKALSAHLLKTYKPKKIIIFSRDEFLQFEMSKEEIYKNADLKSVQNSIFKKFWDPTQMETFTKQGYSLKIPRKYSKVEDNGEFVWYRYHLNGDNSMELISYTVPITSEDDENGNNISDNITQGKSKKQKVPTGEINFFPQ